MDIAISLEAARGCGHRKQGGMYLMADGISRPCGKLPLELVVCPTCGGGIRPARGWTWVNGTALVAEKKCERDVGVGQVGECRTCPLADWNPIGRVGLLWIGKAFYRTPEEFTKEAMEMGISRRITAVPNDFVIGETWVFMAHRNCIVNPDGSFTPAVFNVFQPSRIEYVVKENADGNIIDDEKKLQRLTERGITLIRVRASDPAKSGVTE